VKINILRMSIQISKEGMNMSKRLILICCLLITLAILFTGCGADKTSTPTNIPAPTANQERDDPAVSNQTSAWVSDGKISDNEYTSCQSLGDLKVFTRVAGDSVMFGLTAVSEGYLSLGIDPEGSLRDVDIIMCAYVDGNAVVGDLGGSGKHFPHPYDTDEGGKMDLTDISGSRDGLNLTFEFKRKMDTGDSEDQVLKTGENKVIWAVGKTSEFSGPHSRKGSGSLFLVSN
jgi:hypothetical protein